VEGEELVAHRFPSGSIGLASPGDLHPKPKIQGLERQSFWTTLRRIFNPESCTVPAVCIPPSTRLRLREINERMRRKYGLEPEEECTFQQLTAAANTYRDAIRFDNGCCIRIQELTEGQRVTILDMTAHGEIPEPTNEVKASLHHQVLPNR
jgi:hypothetical protein